MQFLVSAVRIEENQPFNQVFSLHHGFLQRVCCSYDYHLFPQSENNLKLHLPYELVLKCLFYLLDIYLESRNYVFAFELLCINRNFQSNFYNKYFHTDGYTPNQYGVSTRIASVFHLLHSICETIQTYEQCDVLEITTSRYKHCNNFFPYNYTCENDDDLQPMYLDIQPSLVVNDIVPHTIKYTIINTGFLATDQVLFANYSYKKGVYNTRYYRCPIVCLRFVEVIDHDLLPTLEMVKAKEWKSFAFLLRKGLGPFTGVYVQVVIPEDMIDITGEERTYMVEI